MFVAFLLLFCIVLCDAQRTLVVNWSLVSNKSGNTATSAIGPLNKNTLSCTLSLTTSTSLTQYNMNILTGFVSGPFNLTSVVPPILNSTQSVVVTFSFVDPIGYVLGGQYLTHYYAFVYDLSNARHYFYFDVYYQDSTTSSGSSTVTVDTTNMDFNLQNLNVNTIPNENQRETSNSDSLPTNRVVQDASILKDAAASHGVSLVTVPPLLLLACLLKHLLL